MKCPKCKGKAYSHGAYLQCLNCQVYIDKETGKVVSRW